VNETYDYSSDLQSQISGSVVLSFEKTNGIMDVDSGDINVVYDPELRDVVKSRPFSYFPGQFSIDSVVRN
jgi:hypothetical protein